MSEWQPIETAPRDGTIFLGVIAGFLPETAWWKGSFFTSPTIESYIAESEGEYLNQCGGVPNQPTHWMPLPEIPRRG